MTAAKPSGGVTPTPGPWRWWTSCSFNRLSSDATGKDGDVLRAVKYSDDVCGIEGSEADMDLIAEAGTVYHETGMTPRQLADKVEQLDRAGAAAFEAMRDQLTQVKQLTAQRDALLGAAEGMFKSGDATVRGKAWIALDAAIALATGGEP